MIEVTTTLSLEESVLERIDLEARRRGRSRDQLIQDSVRRDLAGQLLRQVFMSVDGRANLTSDDALELAYQELDEERGTVDSKKGRRLSP